MKTLPRYKFSVGFIAVLLAMAAPPLAFAETHLSEEQAITAAIELANGLADSLELDEQARAEILIAEPVLAEEEEPQIEGLRAFFKALRQEDRDWQSPESIARLREVVGVRFADEAPRQLSLRPYVADPRWNEAMALLSKKECTKALELATEVLGPPELHVDGEPAILYAFARMQVCSGDAAEGQATLRELAKSSTPVGDLARLALGQRVSTELEDDAARLSSIIADARRLASAGEVDEALENLRELRGELRESWDIHQVRLAEALIFEEAGRIEEAAQTYLGVYRMARSWRSSDRIVAQIEEAERRLGRQIIPFGDRVDRMTELIARGRYRHAQQVSRENAQIRGVSGNEIQGWTRMRQALQNEHQRNRTRAVSQFEEADRLIKDQDVRPRLYFGWARALRRTDAEDEAIALYKRLCDEYPTSHLCAQSLYEAGRLLQYQNDHDEARELFSRMVGSFPFSPYVPDSLWRFALSSYLEGDYEAALPPLAQIVEFYGDQQDSSELTIGLKARYWTGVNYLKMGDLEKAQAWLQATIDQAPLTWYGRLAAIRLEEAGMTARVRLPTRRLTRDEIEDIGSLRLPHTPRLATAAELTRLGLFSEALTEVRSQLGVHPTPEGAISLRAALHLAEDEPNWTHWIMKSVIDPSGPTLRTLRDWGYAFPLNYMELSHQWGDEIGVSPYLLQAIMRQESGFRPTVRSYAGAMGLMQVMPATARYTSRQFLEERSLSNSQILDPSTNVRLGTMYIRIHIAHAADHPPMALAGYNAGPAPLRSWFERYGDREIDAWVESITYQETRGYVRKVMTSYITYQGLYGDGELPHIELQLPDELRRWGDLPEVEAIREGESISML